MVLRLHCAGRSETAKYVYEEPDIVLNVIILVASVLAGVQFFLGYWRAMIASMAAQPLSEKFFVAAGFKSAAMRAEDFGRLLSLHRLMPDVKTLPNSASRLTAYYSAVKMLSNLPGLSGWAQNEMATCTQCLAVIVDQRLLLNLACAADSRSF
jgi:hypothetical protein